ncbi:Intradiol ring-cleavage dioxygenase [Talaromyces proteolyticus]|uniref:Intradiol ring-cleavage dioxygenase n=1 Tax=Talaromyces proteolyticus TaxID=1131652 RepID=A0AAD4PT95_9EURO|nr:Intradiol ring-cleavage dioxygenase [Talaromyces proteolyticus]KAH8692910.1 Intradiol ring-cleavage dioxygenase [Talaromyces proteolyticus]
MVYVSKLAGFLARIALLVIPVICHPGEIHDATAVKNEIHARNLVAATGKHLLDACSNSLEARALQARSIVRRANTVHELRQKRDITGKAQKFRRDLQSLDTYEAINHNMTGVKHYTPNTPEHTIFSANTSCILTPSIVSGPYYVWGEHIRKNVVEDKWCDGIDLHLEVQYIDFNTCKPVPGLWVDHWSANASGIYSGIDIAANEAADGWNSTYLRGVQPTDKDGVVNFDSIFPGHYHGRATHTHLLVHSNVTVNPNGTLEVGTGAISHVGQLFYNTVLRNAVEKTYPYNTNTQPVVTNEEDRFTPGQADNDYDPFPEFLYLGDDITDGLFAWIQVGINMTQDWTSNSPYYVAAAWYGEDGGVENPESPFMNGTISLL